MSYFFKENPGTAIVTVPTASSSLLSVLGGGSMTSRMTAEMMHEQCRLILAKGAMENVAALSALEQHLYTVAPLGEERYKTIADLYAISAGIRVGRW